MANLLIFYLFLFFLPFSLKAQTGTIIFQVSNVELERGGKITAGIFEKENFPEVGKQLQSIEKEVDANYLEVTLTNVPQGIYGAVVFQDVNKDRELETNFLGFPKEPIGFANDAQIKLGPPSFEEASIKVENGKTTIVKISLN